MRPQTKVIDVTDLNREDLSAHLESIINYWNGEGYDYVNSHNLHSKIVLMFNDRLGEQEEAEKMTEDLTPKAALLYG